MYSILICSGIALAVGLGGYFLAWWGWLGGLLIAMLVFIIAWVVIARRFMKQLQPAMAQVRKQAEAGHVEAAMQTLEGMLPMGKWIPMLTGQISAQLGVLALHSGKEAVAMEHLANSSKRVAEGKLMLAALHYRKEKAEEAIKVLAECAPYQRKHALFHNTFAWILNKEDRVDDALTQLNRFLKKVPDHEISKSNRLRLQNKQKMDMKGFGMEWFALGLERPPASMGELRTGRKGFRQPPKQRGKRKAK